MELTTAIRRAPRWAWVTAGGITIGAVGIKLWKGRAVEESDPTAETVGDPSAPYPSPSGAVVNPAAVIVPPVIIGNDADPNQGVNLLQELYVGGVHGLIEAYENVWGPVQTIQMGLLQGQSDTLQDLALAGSAPGSGSVPPQLIAYPVIMPAAPKPVGGANTPSRCPSSFPLGGPPPKCSRVYCCKTKAGCKVGKYGKLSKGKWHLRQDGTTAVKMGNTC